MKKLLALTLTTVITLGLLTAAQAQTSKMLSPLTTFGPAADGSIQPPATDPYPTLDVSGPYQRGFACDPTTGHLILLCPNTGGGSTNDLWGPIFVVDGDYGTNLSTLDTNGIFGPAYPASAVGVADDGAVYVCNQINDSINYPFKIYRWTNIWQSSFAPSLAFSNTIPMSQRYGATMDVRGAGTNTEIIIGCASQGGSSGTNIVVFTTTNGFDFTANPLMTDVTTASLNHGIAFAWSNTFWSKGTGGPLRWMQYNLATSKAVTLASFDNSALPGSLNFGPLQFDADNSLLAAIEYRGGTQTGGPERVWFYRVPNPSNAPVLLDLEEFTPNNNNATAPPGYLSFNTNGTRLYSHVPNNGLLALTVTDVATPPPTLLLELPATNRVSLWHSVQYQMLAYPDCSYQWQKNGTNIPNATNWFYTIPLVTNTDAGQYSVRVSNSAGSTNSNTNQLFVVDASHLKLLWSAVPGDAQWPFVTSTGGSGTPNERTIAYNALSNQLYVAYRSASAGVKIYVVDPETGTNSYMLNVTGISGGDLQLVGIAVAEDGVIYACNEVGNGSLGGWKLYRWADSAPTTVASVVYTGDPSTSGIATRWGDAMAVRGSGASTRIIIDNQGTVGAYLAVLTPTDQYCTNFTAKRFDPDLTLSLPDRPIGRSIQWGIGDTCWQKRGILSGVGRPLIKSTLDLITEPPPLPVYELYTNFPAQVGACALHLTSNWMAAISFSGTAGSSPDQLVFYDISDPANPTEYGRNNFPINKVANANQIGQVLFVDTNYVFAIDGNNGLLALRPVAGLPGPPRFINQPRNLRVIQGGSGSLSVVLDETATLQWQKDMTNLVGATKTTYAITSASLANAGAYRCIATNLYGSATSDVAVVTVVPLSDVYQLSPIWSNAIGSQPWLTFSTSADVPYCRSIAYNALSNQLYVVNRDAASDAGLSISVLDPATGAKLYELQTNGIISLLEVGTNAYNLMAIDVAEDGSIYAGNMCVPSAAAYPATYLLYRWSNSAPTTVPVLVYSGEPANSINSLRWGDVMDVRGSGMGTEVVIDQQRAAEAVAAVLVPADASLNTFTNKPFTRAYVGANPIGRSIQFGPTNTVWQKKYGSRLELASYDLVAQTSTLIANFTFFPSTMAGVEVDLGRKLVVGVDFIGTASTPDKVNLYDFSDPALPMLIANYNFPTNKQGNDNHISQCVFAGNRVFALDANNGLVAFDLVAPSKPSLTITPALPDMLLSWPANFTGWTLQATPSLTPTVTWTNVGSGTVVGGQFWVTNAVSASSLFYRLSRN